MLGALFTSNLFAKSTIVLGKVKNPSGYFEVRKIVSLLCAGGFIIELWNYSMMGDRHTMHALHSITADRESVIFGTNSRCLRMD